MDIGLQAAGSRTHGYVDSRRSYNGTQLQDHATGFFGDHIYHGNVTQVLVSDNAEATRRLDRKIADWLAPPRHAEVHHNTLAKVTPGTLTHFLRNQSYVEWLQGRTRTLLVLGSAGSGKTFLSAVIVRDLQRKFRDNSKVLILFLYSSYKRKSEQTATMLLSSLLRQAFVHNEEAGYFARELYFYYNEKLRNSNPGLGDLFDCLRQVLSQYSRTIIVMDAMDECVSTEGDLLSHRSIVLKLLRELQNRDNVGLSILLTSRPTLDLDLPGAVRLQFRTADEDINTYINFRLGSSSKKMFHRTDVLRKVHESLCGESNGTFLLAQLQMDLIVQQTRPSAVLTLLEEGPRSTDVLRTAYLDTIARIKDGPHAELASKTLACIVFSETPLHMIALQHALAMDEARDEITNDDLDEVEIIIGACAGLVGIEDDTGLVQLVHQTAQLFLESLEDKWFRDNRYYLIEASLRYLAMPQVAVDAKVASTIALGRTGSFLNARYPLFECAASVWFKDVGRPLERSKLQQISRILRSEPLVYVLYESAAQTMLAKSGLNGSIPGLGPGMQWMHLAAFLDLETLLDLALRSHKTYQLFSRDQQSSAFESTLSIRRNALANVADDAGNKPFVYAAAAENGELCTILSMWTLRIHPAPLKGLTPEQVSLDIAISSTDPTWLPYRYADDAVDIDCGLKDGTVARQTYASPDKQVENFSWSKVAPYVQTRRECSSANHLLLLDCKTKLARSESAALAFLVEHAIESGWCRRLKSLLFLADAWNLQDLSDNLQDLSENSHDLSANLRRRQILVSSDSDTLLVLLQHYNGLNNAVLCKIVDLCYNRGGFSRDNMIKAIDRAQLCFNQWGRYDLFFEACISMTLPILQYCVSNHADLTVDLKSVRKRFQTPLMTFVGKFMSSEWPPPAEVTDILTYLCQGSDLNYQSTKNGMTALHIAACWTFKYRHEIWAVNKGTIVLETLQQHGADPYIWDDQDRTAREIRMYGLSDSEADEDYFAQSSDAESSDEEGGVDIAALLQAIEQEIIIQNGEL